MGYPVIQNLEARQGSTYSKVLRWGVAPLIYKAIQSASNSAPLLLGVNDHGIVDGWPFVIVGVRGMTPINVKNNPALPEDYLRATVRDVDTIEVNTIDASGFPVYQSGGYIRYSTPVDMTGYKARMHIREKVSSTEVLVALTTENGGIAIDNTLKTITITIDAAVLAALSFKTAVYDLEMVAPGIGPDVDGPVTAIIAGNFTLGLEVTRP